MIRRLALIAVPGLLLFVFQGCGRGPSTVLLTGHILGAGSLFPGREASPVQLTLIAAGPAEDRAAGLSFSGLVDSDGSFVIEGAEGQGIPPGTYTIAITSTAYGNLIQQLEMEETYNPFSPELSPLRYEVTADKAQGIVIDLQAGTVQREP